MINLTDELRKRIRDDVHDRLNLDYESGYLATEQVEQAIESVIMTLEDADEPGL